MKKILIVLVSAALLCLLAACSAGETAGESSAAAQSAVSSESTSSIASEESATESGATAERDALTEHELALLEQYLTETEENATELADFRKEPVLLGIVNGYTVCSAEYAIWGEVEDGTINSVFPYFPMHCGVYLIGGSGVLPLEQAIGELVTEEEVYSLLTQQGKNLFDYQSADTALSEQDLSLLTAFLDTVESQGTLPEDTIRGDAVCLGTVGDYALVQSAYRSANLIWESAELEIPAVWDYDCHVFPENTSRCGVYLVGNGEVIKLEDAIGTTVAYEDVYGLLPLVLQCRLDMALDFAYVGSAGAGTVQGVK